MNIKFGMNNFYTRYLKRFLNSEFQKSSTILGNFCVEDLSNLIKYLNLPETKTIFEVQKGITTEFEQLKRLFNVILQDDKIYFLSKNITEETSRFLQDNFEALEDYCYNMGWQIDTVSSWIDSNMDINSDGNVDDTDRAILSDIVNNSAVYSEEILQKADINIDGYINQKDIEALDTYMQNNRLYLVISSMGRENIFPNEDMKVFVNQFTGDFMYNYAIRDANGSGTDDVVHGETSGKYKVGLYKCKPRSKINYIS